jgi:hypothetical protein
LSGAGASPNSTALSNDTARLNNKARSPTLMDTTTGRSVLSRSNQDLSQGELRLSPPFHPRSDVSVCRSVQVECSAMAEVFHLE